MNSHLFANLRQPELGEIFKSELADRPWSQRLEAYYGRLLATEKIIVEAPSGQQPLATELWNICFPKPAGQEFWHYTSLDNLDSILNTREIWLHSLLNRMNEGELKAFPMEFGFEGLLEEEDGLPRIYSLARDLFYLSLTDSDEPGDMWGFGEVRLKFRVQPVMERVTLRKMAYSAGIDHPLNVLREFSIRRFGRHFMPWQVSRQGAFLLGNYFSWESEVRLLIKRFAESTDLCVRQSGGTEAVAIPLCRDNERVRIDLLAVEAETSSDLARAQACLKSNVPEWGVQLILSGG